MSDSIRRLFKICFEEYGLSEDPVVRKSQLEGMTKKDLCRLALKLSAAGDQLEAELKDD